MLSELLLFMSYELLFKIFNTNVFPHFIYCCTVWGNMKNKIGLHKLWKLLKRVARVIVNKYFYSSTSEMLQQLNWMPLADFFVYITIILVFKVLQDLTPNYLEFFQICKWNKHKINKIKPKQCIIHPNWKT